MKTVTYKELEDRFDAIFEDVVENHIHYKIILEENKAVMIVPYEEYKVLMDTYNVWIEQKEELLSEDNLFNL